MIVASAFFMENLDGSVINTALPQMALSMGVSAVDMSIGITSYLITLAAFAALVVTDTLAISPFVALAVVVPLFFALGYLLQRGLLNRTLGDSILPPLLVTFGLSVIIQNVLLEVFGANIRRLPVGDLETASLQLPGGIAIGVFPLIVFVAALICLGALQYLLYHTRLGRAFRATSDGHRQPASVCPCHGYRTGVHRACRCPVRHPHHLRSSLRANSPYLRVRGSDHWWTGESVGHVARWGRIGHRPVDRCSDLP